MSSIVKEIGREKWYWNKQKYILQKFAFLLIEKILQIMKKFVSHYESYMIIQNLIICSISKFFSFKIIFQRKNNQNLIFINLFYNYVKFKFLHVN